MDVSPRALGRWLPVAVATLALAPAARADTIDQTATGLRWYDETQAAVTASGQAQQAVQNRIWAVSWLAGGGFEPQFGARPLRRVIQRELDNRLSRLMLDGRVRSGQRVVVGVRDGELDLQVHDTREEATAPA